MTLSSFSDLDLIPAILIVAPLIGIGMFIGAELARRTLLPVFTALLALLTKKGKNGK